LRKTIILIFLLLVAALLALQFKIQDLAKHSSTLAVEIRNSQIDSSEIAKRKSLRDLKLQQQKVLVNQVELLEKIIEERGH
jgi:hypothetical protein